METAKQRIDSRKQQKQLIDLIRDVCLLYGEPESFIMEYTEDTLRVWEYDIPRAIACFEDLKQQALSMGRKLPKKPVERIKGSFLEL